MGGRLRGETGNMRQVSMKLKEYREKRHFGATLEPPGASKAEKKRSGSLIYVV